LPEIYTVNAVEAILGINTATTALLNNGSFEYIAQVRDAQTVPEEVIYVEPIADHRNVAKAFRLCGACNNLCGCRLRGFATVVT